MYTTIPMESNAAEDKQKWYRVFKPSNVARYIKFLATTYEGRVILTMLFVNVVNISLVGFKAVSAFNSGSFSFISSTLESFGDVLVGLVLIVQKIMRLRASVHKYPRGRNTESASNISASTTMLVLGLVNLLFSIDRIWEEKYDPKITETELIIIITNAVVKLGLYFLCRWPKDDLSVLRRDQLNDVCTCAFVIVMSLLAQQINKYFDLIGSVVVMALVLYTWIPVLFKDCRKSHGRVAKSWKVQTVRKAVEDSHMAVQIEKIWMYHRCEGYIVELYISCTEQCPNNFEGLKRVVYDSFKGIDLVVVYSKVTLPDPNADHMSFLAVGDKASDEVSVKSSSSTNASTEYKNEDASSEDSKISFDTNDSMESSKVHLNSQDSNHEIEADIGKNESTDDDVVKVMPGAEQEEEQLIKTPSD